MEKMIERPTNKAKPASALGADIRGYSKLVIDATIGVTGIVENMHSNITRAGGPLGKPSMKPARGVSGLVYRSVDALRNQPGPDGMLVAPLFPYEPRFGFEVFELTLLPGYERLSEAHEPGVTEHVIVLRGAMEVLVEGKWIELAVGNAVRFSADRPHGYRNTQAQPSVFHNLIHYAKTAIV